MKILTIDEMLDLANESDMPDFNERMKDVEQAATKLAESIASHLGIRLNGPATFEGECGGTAAAFCPATPDQKCPPCLASRDMGGDWEYSEQSSVQ